MTLNRAVALATAAALLLAATASAVAQPSPSPDAGAVSGTDLRVDYPAGNARTFAGGEQNTWSIHMSQSLQPRGPHEAGSVESSMDLELTESVEVLGDGRTELTLEVTDAQAFGFRAGKEQAEALGRRLTAVYDGKSLTLPHPEQSFGFFGTPGAIHMADVALKAHIAGPVLPADYAEGDELDSQAVLPAGWSKFSHRLEGTTTVGASQQRQGAELVGLTSTQSAGTEISLPSLDNPVETIQGGEADLNEFFLATIFKVLAPPGTEPRSLLPDFPMQIGDARVHDDAPRRRKRASGRRRIGPALLACTALLAMGGCASHPQFAGVATSVRLDGPMQFQQKASLHIDSGILVHSATEASAALTGTTIRPNDQAREDLGEQLWALTGVDVALDASWTIEQVLTSELPSAQAQQQERSDWTMAAGLAALAALAIGLLVRRAS